MHEVMEDMERHDKSAKEKYGDGFEPRKLGGKLHRAFMDEIGEEMCQAEVAHHAQRLPEYFCSRPEKHIHVYKPLLAVDTESKRRRGEPGLLLVLTPE